MRFWILTAALCTAVAGFAHAQVEELFSKHVRVLRPQGEFAGALIKVSPAGGAGWREWSDPESGLKLSLPDGLKTDAKPEGTRRLQVVMSELQSRPRPVLRIDVFKPDADDPTAVDLEYVDTLAEQYPQQAFEGRFTVRERGLVQRLRGGKAKRESYAMVGGAYTQGAAPAYRVQWTHLSPERQVFITFDCAEPEWSRYSELLARVLLSLELPGKEKE